MAETPGVLIRTGRESDVAPVRALLGAAYERTYVPLIGKAEARKQHDRWHAEGVLCLQLSEPDTSFLVAEGPGGLLGHAFASARRAPVLFIARLYVKRAAQRTGIGSAILGELTARHPETRLDRLYVVPGNDAAYAFYAAQGFSLSGETMEDGARLQVLERRRGS